MFTLRQFLLFIVLCLPFLSYAQPVIDINSADAKSLDRVLKGIGPVKAEAIVAFRQEHGFFKSIDDLVKVKGINKKLIDINRRVMSVKFGAKPVASISWSTKR